MTQSIERPLRVMIVDDHEMARAGLRALLGGMPMLELVAEAASGADAVRIASRLRPDLMLIDLRMPDVDGFEVIRQLRETEWDLCIVVVTMHDDPEYLQRARELGADGYVLKDASRSDLLGAIEIALRSRSGIPERDRLIAAIFQIEERLTERESDVLNLLMYGLSNREIGERLGIAPGTAKVHIERILAKLGVADRTQAALRAAAFGLTGKKSR